MNLRRLIMKDAPLMVEWMHDDSVVHYLKEDFADKTIEDCRRFIDAAQNEMESINLAIADEHDEYMGTVSLKHIQENIAEFGIALRTCAMGGEYALFGMKEIFEYGYKDRGIDTVYWCVDPRNLRAIRFYDKHKYLRCSAPVEAVGYSAEEKRRFVWYKTKL